MIRIRFSIAAGEFIQVLCSKLIKLQAKIIRKYSNRVEEMKKIITKVTKKSSVNNNNSNNIKIRKKNKAIHQLFRNTNNSNNNKPKTIKEYKTPM